MRHRYSYAFIRCLPLLLAGALLVACGDDDGDTNNNANDNTNTNTNDNTNQNNNNTGRCGNGVLDDGEQCDGALLGGATCQSEASLPDGSLSCDASCLLVTTDCHDCGNGEVEGPEACDDGTNDGAYGGCATDCLGRAPYCGDGVVNGDESCDGTNFGGLTCDASGFPGGGALSCTDCVVDTDTCCQDGDADGYGLHCDLGGDCDDAAPGIVGDCTGQGCPQGYVRVAAGDFQMGCNQQDPCSDSGHTDERPRITVTLSEDFCVAITEVAVGDFRACLDGGTCDATPTEASTDPWCNWSPTAGAREDQPINAVTWWEAEQYCQDWMGGALPTEAEWEKAARGASDFRSYPWGDADPTLCDECNWDLSGPGQEFGCNQVSTSQGPATWEVGHISGTAGDSPYGAKDMAGNVSEWVRDCYLANKYDQCTTGCTDPVETCTDSSARVVRGGFYSSQDVQVKVVRRDSQAPANRDPGIGFRCIWRP